MAESAECVTQSGTDSDITAPAKKGPKKQIEKESVVLADCGILTALVRCELFKHPLISLSYVGHLNTEKDEGGYGVFCGV